MTPRSAIVSALATVPGITAKPTVTGPVSPGDAWPAWRSTRWANLAADGPVLGAWYVFVALSTGGADVTVMEADPLVDVVARALMGAGLHVVTVEPYQVTVAEGGIGIPVLRYTVDDE